MLLKGAYGLTDASRMWYKFNEILIQDGYVVDPALYFKYDNSGTVIGIILCHVDDFLYSGLGNEITMLAQLIKKNFEVKTIEDKVLMFCGFEIEVIDVGMDGESKISFTWKDF